MRNLLTLGEHDSVLSRSNRSTLPTDELADFPVETDLRAALAHKPDAVIISNPTALHLEVAIPAAESGAHLLIEKPIAHSLHHIPDLENALRRGGGQALTAFQFRWHPALQHAKDLLAEGAIGNVVSARAHWGEYLPRWHPWEDYRQSYSARPEGLERNDLFLAEMRHFLAVIGGEAPTACTLKDGTTALQLALAAYESA